MNNKNDIFQDVEKLVHEIRMPRNAYINAALDFYNKIQRRSLLKKQLHKESKLVGAASLDILREFESLEDGLD